MIPRLAAASGLTPLTDGTRADTLRKNREWGVERAVLLPVATSPDCAAVNRFALSCADGHFIPFASVHPDTPEPEAVLEQLRMQELTIAPGTDLERHAYSVNDRIRDASLRNMHILTAV